MPSTMYASSLTHREWQEKSLMIGQSCFQHVTGVWRVPASRIIVYGISIGTAAAVALLSETQATVAGQLLLSIFENSFVQVRF